MSSSTLLLRLLLDQEHLTSMSLHPTPPPSRSNLSAFQPRRRAKGCRRGGEGESYSPPSPPSPPLLSPPLSPPLDEAALSSFGPRYDPESAVSKYSIRIVLCLFFFQERGRILDFVPRGGEGRGDKYWYMHQPRNSLCCL